MSTSSPTSREVVKLDLTAGSVQTVEVGGHPHIVLRPAIEELGLDYGTQLRKLKSRSWAVVGSAPTTGADGKTYVMSVVPVRTFLMLLATVNEQRVVEEHRETLIAFQTETADAIDAYWTRGGAINPSASEDQLDSLISRAKRQAEVLSVLSGIVDASWLETKARLVAARALGEEPEMDRLNAPLYVPDFVKSKGLKRQDVTRVQSWFGRRAAAVYETQHGTKPGKRQTDLPDGSVRETYAWTERDRPVFENTWALHYAAQFPVQAQLGGAA